MSAAVAPQASLARLRRFGVRPNRQLGQNFLIDSNILEVIERGAELGAEDVVLEIGGGLGVLTEHLAQRVAAVHVVEIDRRLEPALAEATAPFANVEIHWCDAMALNFSELRPAPDKLVSNLPYGIAAGVLLRTIEELPGMRLWLAMVQREVGRRLAARPGGSAGARARGGHGARMSAELGARASGDAGSRRGPVSGARDYGVSSVIAQLSCEVELLRSIPRTVFHPQPNVDSALVRMRRVGAPPSRGARALVRAAFAHRRKPLASSVALCKLRLGGEPLTRERVRGELRALGLDADVRAERVAVEEFAQLAAGLSA